MSFLEQEIPQAEADHFSDKYKKNRFVKIRTWYVDLAEEAKFVCLGMGVDSPYKDPAPMPGSFVLRVRDVEIIFSIWVQTDLEAVDESCDGICRYYVEPFIIPPLLSEQPDFVGGLLVSGLDAFSSDGRQKFKVEFLAKGGCPWPLI